MDLPSVSVVIPTCNSERTLSQCLASVTTQDYPSEQLEVIIVDAYSRDATLRIAKAYGVDKVILNPLTTGEAGKALGVEAATKEIVALIDSDNVLPSIDWMTKMVQPFRDPTIVAAEPLYYSHRHEDPLVTRYCSLVGMNDVLCLFLGNYDRYSYLTGKWTESPIKSTDCGDFLRVVLVGERIPTMGANGFLARTALLRELNYKPYLFDIDVVHQMVIGGHNTFAKVKLGIVHLFAKDPSQYVTKTRRRISDYMKFENEGERHYPWMRLSSRRLEKFILYTLFLLPLMRDSAKGYKKNPDIAWLFHPLACWITLLVYSMSSLPLLIRRRNLDHITPL